MRKVIRFVPGNRAGIKEDPLKEGIIEIRPGTKGIDLGERKYAMAYIRVLDEEHCFKGMCVYSDNLPDGYDVICYFGTPQQGLKVLKKVKPEMNLGYDIMKKVVSESEIWLKAWETWETEPPRLACKFLKRRPKSSCD